MFKWLTQDSDLSLWVACVSEGYCPKCRKKLTQTVPFETHDDDPLDEHPSRFAQGGCIECGHWVQVGHNGSDPERDWMNVTAIGKTGCRISLSLNPPEGLHGD